jgi:hypothetical protein
MINRPRTTRLLIIGFLILVGICLARSIYYQSTMGVILALVGLGAAIYIIYLLGKAKEQLEELEWEEMYGNKK